MSDNQQQGSYQDKDNTGTMFANKNKTNDRQPGMRGRAKIGGKEYWVSAWKRYARNSGDVYLSLAFEPVEQQASGAPTQATTTPAAPKGEDLEDLPF